MALWLVESRSLNVLSRLDSHALTSAGFRHSVAAQEILGAIHDSGRWVACDCKSPSAVMFVRRSSHGLFSLVNHSEHGVHGHDCPYETAVKGAPRELADRADEGDAELSRDRFIFVRSFRSGEPAVADDRPKVERQPSERRDSLREFLVNLLEDSYGNIVHRIRHPFDAAATFARMRLHSDQYKVNGHPAGLTTFTGHQGYDIARRRLIAQQESDPTTRHFASIILFASSSELSDGVLTVRDERGKLLVVDRVLKPAINFSDLPSTGPAYIVLLMAFTAPTATVPAIIKWSVTPVASVEVPLPCDDDFERAVLLGADRAMLLSKCGEHKLWLSVPGRRQDEMTGIIVQPVAMVSIKAPDGHTERLPIVMEDIDDELFKAIGRTYGDAVVVTPITSDLSEVASIVAQAINGRLVT